MSIASVGLSFAVEQDKSVCPNQGYIRIPGVLSIPEKAFCSDWLFQDKTFDFQSFYTDALVDIWKMAIEMYQKAIAESLSMWFCCSVFSGKVSFLPKVNNAIFFLGKPLGMGKIEDQVDYETVDLSIRVVGACKTGKVPKFK